MSAFGELNRELHARMAGAINPAFSGTVNADPLRGQKAAQTFQSSESSKDREFAREQWRRQDKKERQASRASAGESSFDPFASERSFRRKKANQFTAQHNAAKKAAGSFGNRIADNRPQQIEAAVAKARIRGRL